MNIADLLITEKGQTNLDEVVLTPENRSAIQQLVKEHRFIAELSKYGLPVNNKLLLHGSSGCGKTITAKAIATALDKPIYILNLSQIISSRIGETSQNLKLVFDKAGRERAVLFLDEFDQLAKARGSDDKDVGEMRRLVNTLIQLIDYFPEKALLICATNHVDIIDQALLRRFQLRITYEMPSNEQLDTYYTKLLAAFPADMQEIQRRYQLSYAEAKHDLYNQLKTNLLQRLVEAEDKELLV